MTQRVELTAYYQPEGDSSELGEIEYILRNCRGYTYAELRLRLKPATEDGEHSGIIIGADGRRQSLVNQFSQLSIQFPNSASTISIHFANESLPSALVQFRSLSLLSSLSCSLAPLVD
jgi:hypothetical protein